MQVHNKPISAEWKFGGLPEMVIPVVRGNIGNLKPIEIGYKAAWELLKTEYGQKKLVVSPRMQEIVNLKIQEFSENLSRRYNALGTIGKANMLRGFVIPTRNKFLQVKPELLWTDDNWENWKMKDLMNNLQGWLKRNRMEEQPGTL